MKKTARFRISPSTSANSSADLPISRPQAATARPPTNAAMNPLPPRCSAPTQAMSARAMNAIHLNVPVIHSRLSAAFTSHAPTKPTASPTTRPIPIRTRALIASDCSGTPVDSAAASARKK